jgi:putative lipoic acid-binding regulatory protein
MSEETLLEFPCDFPIKIMGKDSPEFRAMAVALIESHTGPLEAERVQTALSRNGRFVSITVTVNAQSKDQLDDIYRDVSGHPSILMAL